MVIRSVEIKEKLSRFTFRALVDWSANENTLSTIHEVTEQSVMFCFRSTDNLFSILCVQVPRYADV